ncbi:hypothetical protein HD806DRAFT_553250 [Xylariaceae sp. AK1471]|nr:hypothetical protein HD806DRAFT_553250 [Xylariaceae sp. AK1471]
MAKEAERPPRSVRDATMQSPKRRHLQGVDELLERTDTKRMKLKEEDHTYQRTPAVSGSTSAQTKPQSSKNDLEGANTAKVNSHLDSNNNHIQKIKCDIETEQNNPQGNGKVRPPMTEEIVEFVNDIVKRKNAEFEKRLAELERKEGKQASEDAKADKLKRAIKRIEGECDQNEKNLDAAQQQNSTLQRENAELKQKVHELLMKEAEVDKLIKTILDERNQLKGELSAVQQQKDDLIEDIELIGKARQSVADLDDNLESQFRDLRQRIRGFTRDLCGPKIKASSLPDNVRSFLAKLSGIPTAKFLRSSLHARFLVEALIWRFLCDYILESPFSIWGHGQYSEIGTFIAKVWRNPNVSLSRRELWRQLTAQLLDDITVPCSPRILARQSWLVSHLEPLVNDKHEANIAEHVKPIVDEAVKFAKSLALSRTLVVVQRKTPSAEDGVSQKYNAAWMEIVEKSIEHYEDIDFLVSPALIQVANSAGEAFRARRVFVKAEVCFGQGRSHMYNNPTSEPSPNGPTLAGMTLSGRATRAVDRLGKVADDAELEKVIGKDQTEVLGSDSEAFKDESAEEDD